MMVVLADSPLKTRPLRIFVVEDHPVTAKYLRLYLELHGHSVVCADSMADALTKLPWAGCNVLLCDICLPDGSGWDLLPAIEGHLPQPTYTVAVSICASEEDHARSEKAGFLHHLNKPIHPEVLDAVLDQAAYTLASLERNGANSSDEWPPAA